jgi:hypothetical protein
MIFPNLILMKELNPITNIRKMDRGWRIMLVIGGCLKLITSIRRINKPMIIAKNEYQNID